MANPTAEDSKKLAVLENKIEHLEDLIDTIKKEKEDLVDEVKEIRRDKDQCVKEIDQKYLTKENFNSRFSPVQMISFGIVGTIVMSILTAIIAFLIKTGPALTKFPITGGQ